jgi:hypothetical protein
MVGGGTSQSQEARELCTQRARDPSPVRPPARPPCGPPGAQSVEEARRSELRQLGWKGGRSGSRPGPPEMLAH